jgi:succinate dehydrogenase/fumarate reductase flavoprotein subunit
VSVCTRLDLPILMQAGRDAAAAWYAARLVARGWRDRLAGHPRGTRMTNGNALVGRLLMTLVEHGVELRRDCAVVGLEREAGRVVGVQTVTAGRPASVRAPGGVLFAAGGFSGSDALKARYFEQVARHAPHHSLPPATNTGDALCLGREAGAAVIDNLAAPGAWTPVSLVPKATGGSAAWPHFGDKAKPGVIAVTASGERFVNEADSYHAFVAALLRQPGGTDHAFLIADHRALRRYGLGAVRPTPWPLAPHLRNGYLRRGTTLRELAAACAIDGARLEATVAAFNAHAAQGHDPQFGRGTTLFNRKSGDADWGPNPALGPLLQAPFYALRVVPGDIGTFFGLRTDEHAQVLDADGCAIPGLYAAGNDAASLFGGDYPAAGITLGPALTFGHIGACHALGARPAALAAFRR